ncbi:MAG: chitobiase/beta-hexosaminidase C-terminal domain-containing protein [Muribaculaceae bacterium]|nr:chitobiase/beta-hexosaminidase C-terminal domain-containing protein [Muribaculaceae bacterium]
MSNSVVASATYTIGSAPVAPEAPTFTPAAGTYTTAQNVTIACATAGADIRYTLDGSNPTTTSALYSGPIAISETITIKAVAVKDGLTSAIAVAAYTIQGDTPEPSGLTLVWEQKFSTPASSDARFATGFNGAIYAAQKATSDAPGKILKYTKDGVTTFATVEGMGAAISSDDAGNLLVNKGFPGVGSSTSWVIIEPNGTQHELTIELPSGIEACRVDQVGRVVGNLMSADGGYFFIAGNAQAAVAAIKVVNGAQDTSASAASPTVLVAMNTSTLAQPMFETVEETEAFVDPSAAFYSRNRGLNTLFSWMEDGSEQYALDASFGAGGNEGFDIVKYIDTLFGVVSLARTSEFTLRNITDGEQVAAGGSADEAVSHQFRAYTLRKDGNLCGIYVWNAGHSARYYTIALVSGVESVAGSDAVEVASTYYNLQGVRIDNPSAGQIYIRVATLSDGSVRTSKVVVR